MFRELSQTTSLHAQLFKVSLSPLSLRRCQRGPCHVRKLIARWYADLRVLDCGPGVTLLPTALFPSHLISLHLSAPQPPLATLRALLRSSAPTLRSFHCHLATATALGQLLDCIPLIAGQITSLSIVNGWLFDGDPIPYPLRQLVRSCTRLKHLRLEGFSLVQLRPLLSSVETRLDTVTMEDIVGDGESGSRRASEEIAVRLSECARGVRAMEGLREWRVLVPEFRAQWRRTAEWIECERVLEARGTRVVWLKKF